MPNESSPTSPRFFRRKTGFWRWNFSELVLLGGIVALGVTILVIHLLTWGIPYWQESRHRVETTCTVERLFVRVRHDANGGLFCRPEVEVAYVVDGVVTTARAYDRSTLEEDQGFDYTEEEARARVQEFTVGEQYPCWYPQENPQSVVLKKTGSFWGWCFLLIPVTLIGFGAGGLLVRGWARSRSKEQRRVPVRKNLFPTVPDVRRINESPGTDLAIRLPLVFFPVLQTVTGMMLAIFWNVLAWGIFFYILSIRRNLFDLVASIAFGLVFCGAGLVFLPWFVKRFRAAFGIGGTILEISDHPIYPGRKYRLTLLQNGALHAKRYEVAVSCEEVTRYRQGTDTVTHRKEVFVQTLFLRESMTIGASDTVRDDFFLKIPLGAMHSMAAESNQIHWKIAIEIESASGTSLRRECPLVVMPLALAD